MESEYNILLAAWTATWLITQWRVFLPSMMLLREMDNSNPAFRWWPATWTLFGILSAITVPIMLIPVLSDKYRDIFIKGYVNNLMKIEK